MGAVRRFQRPSSAACAKHQQLGPQLYWTIQPGYHAGGSGAHGRADWAGPCFHAARGWGPASSTSEVLQAAMHVLVFHVFCDVLFTAWCPVRSVMCCSLCDVLFGV